MSTSSVVSTETLITPRRRSLRIWLLSMAGAVVLAAGWIGYVAMLNGRVRAEQLGAYQAAQSRDQMRIPAYPNATGQTFATQRFAQNNNPNSQQGNTFASNIPVVQQYNAQYQQNQPGYYTIPTPPVDRAEAAATQTISELSNQIRNATGEQKKALRKSLTEAVGKLFDLRHAAQAKQVEKLESELAEAKELLKKRSERKDEIVDRRIAELLQSADDLAWNRGIANPPVPATNYALQPNGYPQALLPNGTYNTVPSGSYPNYSVVPNPYNTAPTYSPGTLPGTLYSNPLPPSSTRPQLIPMLSPDSGQSSLLQTTPSSSNANSIYSVPSAPSATTSPSSASSQLLPLLNASPEDVVRQFVTSLQNNDTLSATKLLTGHSQEEMVEAKFQLQPIQKTMNFQVGVAKYTRPEKDEAVVDASVTESGQQPYEAVFECNLENGNWRISGMAFQASDQTVTFDFEDTASITEHLKTSIVGRDPEIPLVIANALTIAGVLPNEPKAEMDTQPTETPTSTTSSKSSIGSKAVIEAAYEYEEALDVAIETKKLSTSGGVSARELSTSKRNAAKAKAIWEATNQDLANRRKALEREGRSLETRIASSNSQDQKTALLAELEKAKSELVSTLEALTMAAHFRLSSLERLEKELEPKAETEADQKAEEQKPNE